MDRVSCKLTRAIYVVHGIYFKSIIYFRYGKYDLPIMIVPRLDRVLAKEKRTFYWLAKETGISHTTLWRLKKGKAVGINRLPVTRVLARRNYKTATTDYRPHRG